MEIPKDAYLMWVAAFFYFVAFLYLVRKIRRQKMPLLYTISAYLGGIALFFTFMGLFMVFSLKFFVLLGVLSVMLGASTLALFPLKLEWPYREKQIYRILIILSFALGLGTYFWADVDVMLRVAHGFAFIFAGLITLGYIFYTGIVSQRVRAQSFSTGASLGLCCIVAHGLVAFQFFPLVAISFFGLVMLELPLIFALLSPLAFLYVLLLDLLIKPKK